MKRTNHPIRHLECACGAKFDTTSPSARFCKDCARLRMKLLLRIRSRKGTPHEKVRELTEEAYALEIGKKRAQSRTSGKSKPNERRARCKYCGKTINAERDYCTECVHRGLDEVHKLTGKTNGWNRRSDEKQMVQAGWRGRPCAGGGRIFYNGGNWCGKGK